MIIPLEWLKEYVNTKRPAKEVADSFTSLGLMLDKPIRTFKQGKYTTEILDLEHRMDRSDWLSLLGCARDYAAFEGLEFKLPPVHQKPGLSPKPEQIIKIEVSCPDLVNRFNTKVFRNIKVKPSPDWLKNRLEAYGIPSINNVVDVTNYVMVEYGQPMHAQDLAKMRSPEIVIRRARDGEEVTTLLGETVKLTSDQFVLTQSGQATVIGGIVGGNSTGVDLGTTDIVLDAGNYNQNNIRKSSRYLKIQNETVQRYDKFLHPMLAQLALERAIYLILDLAGGDYYENVDWYPKAFKEQTIDFSLARLEKVGGLKMEAAHVEKIISRLGYEILEEKSGLYRLKVPYFRTDVLVEDDVAADILRISDYRNIPFKMIEQAPPKDITPEIYVFEDKLRDIMVSLGGHEHITDPMVTGEPAQSDQVVLENALTSDQNALRTSILDTLTPVLKNYQRSGFAQTFLFEVGKTYHVVGDKKKLSDYEERRTLQVLQEANGLSAYENSRRTKKLLSALLRDLGIEAYSMRKEGEQVDILVSGVKAGQLGIFDFWLSTKVLLEHAQTTRRAASEAMNYTTERLSLILGMNKPFGPVYQEIKSHHPDIVSLEVEEEYTGEKIGQDKKAVLVKLVYKTSQTEKIRQELLKILKTKHGVEHRE